LVKRRKKEKRKEPAELLAFRSGKRRPGLLGKKREGGERRKRCRDRFCCRRL